MADKSIKQLVHDADVVESTLLVHSNSSTDEAFNAELGEVAQRMPPLSTKGETLIAGVGTLYSFGVLPSTYIELNNQADFMALRRGSRIFAAGTLLRVISKNPGGPPYGVNISPAVSIPSPVTFDYDIPCYAAFNESEECMAVIGPDGAAQVKGLARANYFDPTDRFDLVVEDNGNISSPHQYAGQVFCNSQTGILSDASLYNLIATPDYSGYLLGGATFNPVIGSYAIPAGVGSGLYRIAFRFQFGVAQYPTATAGSYVQIEVVTTPSPIIRRFEFLVSVETGVSQWTEGSIILPASGGDQFVAGVLNNSGRTMTRNINGPLTSENKPTFFEVTKIA